VSPDEALPGPTHGSAVAPQVVGIVDADLLAFPCRRIEEELPAKRRDPLGRARHDFFHSLNAGAGDPYRVSLALFSFSLWTVSTTHQSQSLPPPSLTTS
jgi:hypothetical protein